MTLFPKNPIASVQIVVDVHVQATAHKALFPDEFWDAAMILDPVKRVSHGSDRPKRWGMLVSELVYAPLGIDVDLQLMAKNGCEKWHQHLDKAGRDLVLRQCLLVSRAVRMGTTLSKLRRAFATRSVPKSTISFSFATSTSSRTIYVSRIVP